MSVKQQFSDIASITNLRPSYRYASPEDYLLCRQVMQNSSRNYSFASRFLPASKKQHVEALYAFLRVGDDRVDVSQGGNSSAMAAIDAWERMYWKAFGNCDSPHPIMRAYLNTAKQFGIPPETMKTYFRAMKEDLTITRFPTFGDLMHYMEGSALPVGRALTYILGLDPIYSIEDAITGADRLSVAMQLSNFWRDIGDDYIRIDRIYIPQEDLEEFGYSEKDLKENRIDKRLTELLEFEFERTENYYQQAERAVGMLASGRWGVMSSLLIYRSILNSIRKNQYDVFTKRAKVPLLRKLGLIGFAGWLASRF